MPTGNACNPTDHKLHVLCRALWSNIEAAQSWRYRHALASTATCSSWMACALHCWNIYLPWMSPPTHATWATHRSLMVQQLHRSPLLSSACSVAAATHLLRAIHSLSCTVSQSNTEPARGAATSRTKSTPPLLLSTLLHHIIELTPNLAGRLAGSVAAMCEPSCVASTLTG